MNVIHDAHGVRVIHGDCQSVAHELWRDNTPGYDLIFGDPPFNIGHPYEGFDDRMSSAEYELFTRLWMYRAAAVLRPGGTLCIHVPDDVVPLVFRHKPPELEQADWIIWHYRFGQAGPAAKSSQCINSKAHLLVYTLPGPKPRTWNPPMVPSDRASKYGDRRTESSATPGMRVALDVWGVPSDGPFWGRVQGNSAERWDRKHGALADHPNQLPEVYMERVINAFSNPGDRMLCMFGGSGTETVVAAALGRRIDTIEYSEINAHSIVKRLERGAVRVGPRKVLYEESEVA